MMKKASQVSSVGAMTSKMLMFFFLSLVIFTMIALLARFSTINLCQIEDHARASEARQVSESDSNAKSSHHNLVPNKDPKTVEDLNIHLDNNEWFPAGVFGDNITGYPMFIVPNIVHYVLFQTGRITFSHMISMMSAIRHQKPEIIYIHCDCDKFDDPNWVRVKKLADKFGTKLKVRRVPRPTHIFGHKIDENVINWHGADITRIGVLREFGGIFMDNDVYICQSLDKFRKFEMTVNWDEGQFLGMQVLIGNKKSRFLEFYERTYRLYDTNKWYYNAGELPTTAILYKYPHLVHRIKVQFGVDAPFVCPMIFREYHQDWQKKFYTVHLTLRDHEFSWPEWCFGDQRHWPKVIHFDEESIQTLDVTFGEMARLALYGSKEKRGN